MGSHTPSIITLMDKVLGSVFSGDSWSTWRAVLKAAFALPLSEAELHAFSAVTDRAVPPTTPVIELWLLLGRRSGKSIVAAFLAVYAACVRRYEVAPGETPTVGVFASDRRQARVVKRYISGLLHVAPPLRELVANETADRIELTTGVNIEILTASHRVSRGYTYVDLQHPDAAREDGVELDSVFWQFLLQGDGSQLSHWRRTVRSIGWLK